MEFLWKGEIRNVSASREVILSAGAIDSPKILMLSGVGPKDHLKDLQVLKTVLGVNYFFKSIYYEFNKELIKMIAMKALMILIKPLMIFC